MKLNEKALRPDILKDLIYNIISVDEYTPKLNKDNIVVLFQVLNNYDAAYDLSSFIERSPENILDTEASDTPNVDGRYNVFCEFERDSDFPTKLINLLSDIENICPNVDWKLQLYKVNDPIDLDVKKIVKNMRLTVDDVTELKEFFQYAPVKVQLHEQNFSISTVHDVNLYFEHYKKIKSTDVNKYLAEGYDLDNSGLDSILSTDYTVLKIKEGYIVGRENQYYIMR